MGLEWIDPLIRWLGGLLAYGVLAIILAGIWRGAQRRAGLASGRAASWLRSPWYFVVVSIGFFGLSYLGWKPLPIAPAPQVRAGMLALGSLLYFPGLLFVLRALLALGKNYYVSSGFGVQLFDNHQLVTDGPFATVRRPMYAGIMLASIGSFLIYSTWTTLLFVCIAPLSLVRIRREEAILSAAFGEAWKEYTGRVPAFFPRLWK